MSKSYSSKKNSHRSFKVSACSATAYLPGWAAPERRCSAIVQRICGIIWKMARIAASTLYERIGGKAGCRALSVAFYARLDKDPLLRPLFPGKSLRCAIDAFAAFLAQFLGGPSEDAEGRWALSLHESHARIQIGTAHRAAWMKDMVQALDDVAMGEPIRTELLTMFKESSAYLVNQGEKPAAKATSGELSRQMALDEAVAAIGAGNAEHAMSLAETCSPAVQVGLFALMIGSGQDALVEYVREKVTRDPALVHERIRFGRSLLQESAAAGNLSVTELLLSLGADPNARDNSGHTPLYSAGNECTAGGGDVVRALVRAGADVNASDGAKRCTPLHMAARRGNVEIAGALLDCGANIEARDKSGDTPLQRAMNCRKARVAALLRAWGASNPE
jgi:truncated hemoglobin YjbI